MELSFCATTDHLCKHDPAYNLQDDDTTVCSSLPESEVSPFDEDLSSSACSTQSLGDFSHPSGGGVGGGDIVGLEQLINPKYLNSNSSYGVSAKLDIVSEGFGKRHQRSHGNDIRRHYACKLGIRHPRVESQQLLPSWSRETCLPEGVRPVVEKLKGRQESYGGFLRLMRRKSEVGSALERSSNTRFSSVTLSESGPSAAGRCKHGGSQRRDSMESYSGSDEAGGGEGGLLEPLVLGLRSISCTSTCSNDSDGCSSRSCSPARVRGIGESLSPPSTSLKRVPLSGCLKKTSGNTDSSVGEGRRKISSSPTNEEVRRIAFLEEVEVVHIPSHTDYSRRVKTQYWSSPEEIYEMACRNLVEYQAEGYDFEQAVEEDQMFYVPETGELVHPAHVDFAYDQSATSASTSPLPSSSGAVTTTSI